MTDPVDAVLRYHDRLDRASDPLPADTEDGLREALEAAIERAALARSTPAGLDVEARRLLGYLWTAEGNDDHRRPMDLFDEDDPIVADVERLAIWPTQPSEETP